MLTVVRDILRQAARTLGLEPAIYLVRAREVWPQVVGPTLAGGTEPRSVRGSTVVVAATHPLVAQEVRLRREEILEGLRRYLPEAAGLRELRVIIRQGARSGGG